MQKIKNLRKFRVILSFVKDSQGSLTNLCFLSTNKQVLNLEIILLYQANHGGVRGKLPKEAEDEEVMEGTADDSDEIMATPDDEVKEEKIHSTVYIYHTYLE